MIEVHARLQRPEFDLDVAFAGSGGVTALFGRSGAGKSTVLAIIAGLVAPDRGRIVVDGEVLLDTARRINKPAHRRRIGLVFQDAQLFPHMSVRHNLEFGRWFAPTKLGISSSVVPMRSQIRNPARTSRSIRA